MDSRAPSFEAIHREFRPRLLRYLAGFVGPDEAADLAQVTMLKVSEHLAGFRGESSLATWIYRIATRVAIDRLRQREPAGVALDFHAEDEVVDDGLPEPLRWPSAEDSAARAEMGACIREFVDALPPHERSVVILSDVEGFSDAEVADVLGLTRANAKMRLHRARVRLRAKLREGCSLQHDERNELACGRILSPASPV